MAEVCDILPSELEFLAEDTIVSIIPIRANLGSLKLLQGTYGPFVQNVPIDVPLWLALRLKSIGHCRVAPPEWLTSEQIKETLKLEKESPHFARLPKHYIEIAQLLLRHAADDIPEAEQVRGAVLDLQSIREEKIRRGISTVIDTVKAGEAPTHVALHNVASMEVNTLHPGFMPALDAFAVLARAHDELNTSARLPRTTAAASAAQPIDQRNLRARFGARGRTSGSAESPQQLPPSQPEDESTADSGDRDQSVSASGPSRLRRFR